MPDHGASELKVGDRVHVEFDATVAVEASRPHIGKIVLADGLTGGCLVVVPVAHCTVIRPPLAVTTWPARRSLQGRWARRRNTSGMWRAYPAISGIRSCGSAGGRQRNGTDHLAWQADLRLWTPLSGARPYRCVRLSAVWLRRLAPSPPDPHPLHPTKERGNMIETDVYAVGVLRDWRHARRTGDYRNRWRWFLRSYHSRSYWNGFLAEHGRCAHNCGHGWTQRAAMRRVNRLHQAVTFDA